MDVPISLGLIAAWLGSVAGWIFGVRELLYFDFVATFAFLMLSGRYIHLRLLDRNRRQLWAREREITTTHRLGANGDRERIPLARIGQGDLLEIAPGGMVPVEAILESEPAKFHLDWINGEPEPVLYATGQRIPAGARNASAHPSASLPGMATAVPSSSSSLLPPMMTSTSTRPLPRPIRSGSIISSASSSSRSPVLESGWARDADWPLRCRS